MIDDSMEDDRKSLVERSEIAESERNIDDEQL